MNIIIGTAGHIDHGKTSLVRSLTGVDADRLPEEKKRGITIDLGFAELRDGENSIGFVDVPGHERFVKNMLAGASGIDAVALVIAADEGVMPQTKEHFEICRLLDTKHGVVILTKTDLVEPEFIELVEADVAELVRGSFLEDAPVLPVSTKTGEGIEEAKAELFGLVEVIADRTVEHSTRLPVDRTFSIKGFGAVVTGTLAAGQIRNGSEMELLPDGLKVRVRGVQTHGSDVDSASAGQRTAVNLGGVEHTDIERGMVLAEPNAYRATQIVDAEVELLADAARPLKSRQRVRVHFGTVEALARIEVLNDDRLIEPGAKDLIQIRFEKPVPGIPGDRFILRQYSPQITVAGGRFLNVHAAKRRRSDLPNTRKWLSTLADPDLDRASRIGKLLEPFEIKGADFDTARAITGLKAEPLEGNLAEAVRNGVLVRTNGHFVETAAFERLSEALLAAVIDHHEKEPLSRGIARETLREQTAAHAPTSVFRKALEALEKNGMIKATGDVVASSEHSKELSPEEKRVSDSLIKLYEAAGYQVPVLKDALSEAVAGTDLKPDHARKVFQLLVNSGELIKVTEEFYFYGAAIKKLIADIREYAETTAENRLIGVPQFKEVAGVSRKYAIPLLEYFDGEGITRRAGNQRLVL